MLQVLLIVVYVLLAINEAFSLKPPQLKSHTALTNPLPLQPGEVTNSFHKLKIPKGPIAVYSFSADIVELDANGDLVPTPVYDAYLHHHVVGSNHTRNKHLQNRWTPMKPTQIYEGIGFGAGTESRGTPQKFYHPYAFVTRDGEDSWIANVHVINTRKLSAKDAHHCSECPCTSENARTNDTINHSNLPWNTCNRELIEENNSACFPGSYYGGLRCCEDGQFCLERDELPNFPKSTFYLRYTIEYTDVTPDVVPLFLASCCDATGDLNHHGNVEYDISGCDHDSNPGCVHTLATKQYIRGIASSIFETVDVGKFPSDIEDKEIDLVYAVGHQHRGGLGISIYDDRTRELLCNSIPIYGSGDNIGNESDYVVAMTHCTFDPPLRMRTTDVLRIVGLYNSTESHTGVMSLFYLAIAEVSDTNQVKPLTVSSVTRAISATSIVIGVLFGGAAAVGLAWNRIRHQRYQYAPLSNSMDGHA